MNKSRLIACHHAISFILLICLMLYPQKLPETVYCLFIPDIVFLLIHITHEETVANIFRFCQCCIY